MEEQGKLDTAGHTSPASCLQNSVNRRLKEVKALDPIIVENLKSRKNRNMQKGSLPPLSDYGSPKRKPRKKKFIKDERLRRINQGDSKNFKTNAELSPWGRTLKVCKECRTADILELLKTEVDVDVLDHKIIFELCSLVSIS